jgi:hypothetical protein
MAFQHLARFASGLQTAAPMDPGLRRDDKRKDCNDNGHPSRENRKFTHPVYVAVLTHLAAADE